MTPLTTYIYNFVLFLVLDIFVRLNDIFIAVEWQKSIDLHRTISHEFKRT